MARPRASGRIAPRCGGNRVGRKHHQAVSKAKLREERIDRSGLDARAQAAIAQGGGFDVIPEIRHDERNRVETIQDLLPGFRPREASQKLLEHKARS
jgi:hypothetical protein